MSQQRERIGVAGTSGPECSGRQARHMCGGSRERRYDTEEKIWYQAVKARVVKYAVCAQAAANAVQARKATGGRRVAAGGRRRVECGGGKTPAPGVGVARRQARQRCREGGHTVRLHTTEQWRLS